MIIISYLPNRFNEKTKETRAIPYREDFKLEDYIKTSGLKIPDSIFETCDVFVNGQVVTADCSLENHAKVVVFPKVKDPISAIYSAVTFIGALLWTAGMYAVAHPFVTAGFLLTGYSIYSAITNKPRLPSYGSGAGIDEGSPTYGWDGIQQTRDVAIPVGVVYGTHRVGGNVVNEYVWKDGEKNYLNQLIALGEGEITGVSSLQLNGNPIENYTGVSTTIRYGTNDQTVIANFEDLHNLYAIGVTLNKNSAYTYTTRDSDVEAFELHLRCPSGIFQQSETTGEILAWSVTYQVEYKLDADVSWTDLGSTTITEKSRSTIRRVFRKDGLTAGKYNLRITKTSDDSSFYKTGDLILDQLDEIKTDDLAYPNTALLAVELLATDQLSGSAPNLTSLVQGKKVSVPNVLNGETAVDWEDYYWNDTESEFRLLSDDTSLTWDGSTYITAYSANPIWCIKDFLLNSRYGLGDYIATANVDADVFLESAKYCDEKVADGNGGYEKRFRLDVVLDSSTSAVDAITQLLATCNGFLFYNTGTIKVKIDKPDTPVQVFGMGNIIEGSFSQSWKTTKEVPNAIEAIFNDADNNYQQETIEYVDATAIASGDPIRKQSLRVFCTRTSQAIRLARYALKLAKYCDRVVKFKAGIDAIACESGDIISVSHDVPQWGFSGRLQAGTTDLSMALDRLVTMEADVAYVMQIRHDDDTIETKSVSAIVGSYSTLTLATSLIATPSAGAVYSFGVENIQTKPFRIISMSRAKDQTVDIIGIEYNANVYDDTAPDLPENNYSALNYGVPPVRNLSLGEHLILKADGTLESAIDVYFDRPDDADYYINQYKSAVIYFSDNAGTSWQRIGQTAGTSFTIQGGITEGSTYKVAVSSVSVKGEEMQFASAPTDSITIAGKTAPPSNVANFEVTQQGSMLRFSWDDNADLDASKSEIRKGSNWDSATQIAIVKANEFMFPVGEIGLQTYLCKHIDTTGNYSTTPATDTLTVTAPPERNIVNTLDLFAGNRMENATLTDLDYVWSVLYDSTYARKAYALKTSKTWEDVEGEAMTWENAQTAGSLNMDSAFVSVGSLRMLTATPFDLGAIFEFNVVMDIDYADSENGTIVTLINYSEDNVTWSDWETLSASTQYRARYVAFGFNVSSTDTGEPVIIYGATAQINAPTVYVDYGGDLAVATGGTSVVFGQPFTETPRVRCQVINGAIGFPVVTAKSTTGFTVKVYNVSGSAIDTAEIDWEARGI